MSMGADDDVEVKLNPPVTVTGKMPEGPYFVLND